MKNLNIDELTQIEGALWCGVSDIDFDPDFDGKTNINNYDDFVFLATGSTDLMHHRPATDDDFLNLFTLYIRYLKETIDEEEHLTWVEELEKSNPTY